MIQFLNPLLLGGLAAVSAPIVIHLLHRRKVKQVDWGAMRFLLELLAQRRRRLFLDEFLLLLIRALLVACVALVMTRPAWFRPSAPGGLARQGGAAVVLLVDDSLSTSAGRAQTAFEAMRKLALSYVRSLARGDEVSLLLMSQLGTPPGDPIFDLEGLKARLGELKPTSAATDIPSLVDAGLAQLKRHVNPAAELVILTDGRNDGWHSDDKVRWDGVRERLRGPKDAMPGGRTRPRVIVLAPEATPPDDNLAVTEVGADRTLVSAGHPASLRVVVRHFGNQDAREVEVKLAVNGEVVGSHRVSVPPGGQAVAVFEHTFDTPGSYGLEASLADNADALPDDDRRAVSVQVEQSVPVLLVDGGAASGLAGKLGFFAAALDPGSGGKGPFQVTRVSLAQFNPAMLADCRVVVFGDLPVLDPAAVEAVGRFVVGGGGVLVGLGPASDAALINRYWARDGEGFLPCALGQPVAPRVPATPAGLRPGHPIFGAFGAAGDEAWKEARVRSYYKLETREARAGEIETLLTLDNGDPLIVERRRGLGLVVLDATSLGPDWTDLPLQAAYVPLMRGIAGRLGSFVMPPRNLRPGEPILYAAAKDTAASITATDSSGRPLKLTPGSWEGRDAVASEPLTEPGVYTLRDPRLASPIRFAVASAPAESALDPITDREAVDLFGGPAVLFHTPERIAAGLDPARRGSAETWRWLLAAAVGLLFLETLVTRRESAARS